MLYGGKKRAPAFGHPVKIPLASTLRVLPIHIATLGRVKSQGALVSRWGCIRLPLTITERSSLPWVGDPLLSTKSLDVEDSIKLPGSSFDALANIIQAYATSEKAMSLSDVSRRTGIDPTTISRNNGFLIGVGVVEGGKSKTATPIGRRLGHALSHSLEAEVASTLQEIVESVEFLRNIVSAIRIRRGMDEGALRAHIAYSAGQSKSQTVMVGTGAIVEALKRAKLIEERDGKYQATTHAQLASNVPVVQGLSALISNEQPDRTSVQLGRVLDQNGVAISISVEVNVSCTPDELPSVGVRLREMLEEFQKVTGSDSD